MNNSIMEMLDFVPKSLQSFDLKGKNLLYFSQYVAVDVEFGLVLSALFSPPSVCRLITHYD